MQVLWVPSAALVHHLTWLRSAQMDKSQVQHWTPDCIKMKHESTLTTYSGVAYPFAERSDYNQAWVGAQSQEAVVEAVHDNRKP